MEQTHLIGLHNNNSGLGNSELIDWDLASHRLRLIPLLNDMPLQCLRSQNGILLTVNQQSGNLALWKFQDILSAPNPRPRLSLYGYDGGKWLAITPEGYYACSPGVEQVLCWEQDGQRYPLAKYAKQYHRPDIIRQALQRLGR